MVKIFCDILRRRDKTNCREWNIVRVADKTEIAKERKRREKMEGKRREYESKL